MSAVKAWVLTRRRETLAFVVWREQGWPNTPGRAPIPGETRDTHRCHVPAAEPCGRTAVWRVEGATLGFYCERHLPAADRPRGRPNPPCDVCGGPLNTRLAESGTTTHHLCEGSQHG